MISNPGYPQSKGLAERYVKTAKLLLKKCSRDSSDIYLGLLNQRNTAKENNLTSANERLINRKTRSLLPTPTNSLKYCQPFETYENIQIARSKQKYHADKGTKNKADLSEGSKINIQISIQKKENTYFKRIS